MGVGERAWAREAILGGCKEGVGGVGVEGRECGGVGCVSVGGGFCEVEGWSVWGSNGEVLWMGVLSGVCWLRLCEGEHVKHTHPWGIGLFCMIPEHLLV